ncbi:MAG: efflux transporter periplasmic adaptor subunit [Rhizobiales bacterium 24-66-13]|jgi:cobalt-zinc-cadmium efflux system membrane fusion protein|nr:MAG: efflux transporter periplasmic adaptor subunit [Rhizobiales bacterium 24-66-13]OZB11973.1 MAG: efflux transporter periplasmic adaptor subunit [Rhizobiales bacterium 39-66-18]HQS45159.1 efflux RND transporter periplasmic adaptor subunit [Xanthobacteraceae bacterium]
MIRSARRDLAMLVIGLLAGAGAYYSFADRSSPVFSSSAAKSGHDEKGGGDGSGGEEHNEGAIELDDGKLAAAGIGLETAGPEKLRQNLRLNGLVQPNQEMIVQVTPRFPGIVREIKKRIGDKVNKGDVLAVIESNQSLTTYDLKAPIAGTVVDRQVALGEYASEQKPAFVVADLSTLWVDLSVYRRDFTKVRVGDKVAIDPDDGGPVIDGVVSYVSPIGSADTQSALARVVIPNDGLRLRPGLFASGTITLAEKPVDLAARLSAVQSVDGRTVIFVRTGDAFELRDVELGERDGQWVEIIFGLMPGDVYAAKNSFVVKAELAKGSASHEH